MAEVEKRTADKAALVNISVDFELAVIQALKDIFVNAKIGGCYFHYVKAIKLKFHKLKKQTLISRDAYIKKGESFLGCCEV